MGSVSATPLDERLTPQARTVLNEALEGLREQTIRRAAQFSTIQRGGTDEITVHDVIAALGRRAEIRGEDIAYASSRLERLRLVAAMYAGLGVIVVLGLVLYVLLRDFDEPILMVAGLAALSITMASMLLYALVRIREQKLVLKRRSQDARGFPVDDNTFRFLELWRQIELSMRYLVAARLGESQTTEPVGDLISELVMEGVLSESDGDSVRQLLQLRNEIAHEGLQLTSSQADRAFKEGAQILDRLRAQDERL